MEFCCEKRRRKKSEEKSLNIHRNQQQEYDEKVLLRFVMGRDVERHLVEHGVGRYFRRGEAVFQDIDDVWLGDPAKRENFSLPEQTRQARWSTSVIPFTKKTPDEQKWKMFFTRRTFQLVPCWRNVSCTPRQASRGTCRSIAWALCSRNRAGWLRPGGVSWTKSPSPPRPPTSFFYRKQKQEEKGRLKIWESSLDHKKLPIPSHHFQPGHGAVLRVQVVFHTVTASKGNLGAIAKSWDTAAGTVQ